MAIPKSFLFFGENFLLLVHSRVHMTTSSLNPFWFFRRTFFASCLWAF